MGFSFRLTARVLLYAPSHREDSTYHSLCYISRGALAGTRNSSMGRPHEGSIRRPIAPWANALTTGKQTKTERQWYRSEHVFLELLDGDLELTFQVPHVHFGLLLVDLLLFEGHVRLPQWFLLQFAEQLVEVTVVERSLEVVVVVHWSRKYSETEIVYKSYM